MDFRVRHQLRFPYVVSVFEIQEGFIEPANPEVQGPPDPKPPACVEQIRRIINTLQPLQLEGTPVLVFFAIVCIHIAAGGDKLVFLQRFTDSGKPPGAT
jgi:hypothetical protein